MKATANLTIKDNCMAVNSLRLSLVRSADFWPSRKAQVIMKNLSQFMSDESGAAAAEYALILALIAVFIITALGALGNGISNTFNSINAKLPAS